MARNFVRALVSASLLGLVVFGAGGGVASAASNTGTTPPIAKAGGAHEDLAAEKAVLQKLVAAPDPATAYRALSSADQALFRLALTHQTAVETQGPTVAVSPGTSFATNTGPASTAATGTQCWYHYLDIEWYDLGINDGETWNQLNWCAANGSITSYNLSNIGGRGKAGQTYVGVKGNFYLNVGWEARAVTEYHFDYANIPFSDVYPCNQIRGGATGQYSTPGADGGNGGDCSLTP